MKRSEAEKLMGTRVEAWTSLNGIYCGVLEAIVPTQRRPWRGVVRIDGILSAPVTYEAGRRPRRGFRVGETIEVGGVNISPTDAVGATDYLALLQAEAERFRETFSDYLNGKFGDPDHPQVNRLYGWYGRAVEQVEEAIESEIRRLAQSSQP
jgi:hypothetical protein